MSPLDYPHPRPFAHDVFRQFDSKMSAPGYLHSHIECDSFCRWQMVAAHLYAQTNLFDSAEEVK
jgi:hypothetical protein